MFANKVSKQLSLLWNSNQSGGTGMAMGKRWNIYDKQ